MCVEWLQAHTNIVTRSCFGSVLRGNIQRADWLHFCMFAVLAASCPCQAGGGGGVGGGGGGGGGGSGGGGDGDGNHKTKTKKQLKDARNNLGRTLLTFCKSRSAATIVFD